MSSDAGRSGRIRKRKGEEDAAQQAAHGVEAESNDHAAGATAVMAAGSSPVDPSALAPQPQPPSLSVQPLPEQMRKRPRRSLRFSSPLDMLAVVELQLVMQWLDLKSKLKAARCSRRLLQAASAPFAWKDSPPFIVVAWSAANVRRIGALLLRVAPIQLRMRCLGLQSLLCVAAVPVLFGLGLTELPESSLDDLPLLLQHLNCARLELLRLGRYRYLWPTVDTMRLIARLPQLHTLEMFVPAGADGQALLQTLTDAPALTSVDITFTQLAQSEVLLGTSTGIAGLCRLSLRDLSFHSGAFLALCSSPNMRRLEHLQLHGVFVASLLTGDVDRPDNEYRAACCALEQLHSLTLDEAFGINNLLPHLHRAPALRLLSIRCQPSHYGIGDVHSPLPSRDGERRSTSWSIAIGASWRPR